MKKFKRILAMVIAMAMVLSMGAMTALADDNAYEETKTYTVTINDNSHTDFKAVQIFKGTQLVDGNDDNPLGNIVWGDNITSDTLKNGIINAINTALGLTGTNAIANGADAQTVAKKLADANLAYNDAKAKDLAQALGVLLKDVAGTTLHSNTTNEVPAGYYIVIDQSTLGDNDARNASLLQMTKDITITKKTDAPKVEKKIVQTDGSTKETNTATVGDDVSFEISSAVPDYTYYDHYYFIMNDKISSGLTFNNDIKVYKAEPNTTAGHEGDFLDEVLLTANTDYYIYTDNTDYTFQVAFENVKSMPIGTKLYVRYSAKLNSNAVIGGTGNTNEADLTYSNNPDDSGRGDETGKPGRPDSTHSQQTGTTPKEQTTTYTAEIDILKTKEDGTTPLAGAEFTLTGTSTVTVLKGADKYEKSDSGTYYRLNDGTFTATAPTAPTMTPAADGATAGYVEDANYTNEDRIVLNNKVYRPYVASTDADKQIYVYDEGNGASYASTTQKYTKTTATETTTETYDVKMVATSGEDGKLKFERLGEGTYTIEETLVPAGYNKADNVTLVIAATYPDTFTGTEKATWSVGTGSTENTFTPKTTDDGEGNQVATVGIYDATIKNQSGSVLPSTGGIGTTIFYVVGAILVIGAGVIMITRRRMDA